MPAIDNLVPNYDSIPVGIFAGDEKRNVPPFLNATLWLICNGRTWLVACPPRATRAGMDSNGRVMREC